MDPDQPATNAIRDAETPVALVNEGEKIDHAISTPHHVGEGGAALDTGILAVAATPAAGNAHLAMHSTHDSAAAERVADNEISSPPLPTVVDSLQAVPKDHVHTPVEREDAPSHAATITGSAVGDIHLVKKTSDEEDGLLQKGHEGGHEPLPTATSHGNISPPIVGSVAHDVSEPPVLGHTVFESDMDVENTLSGHQDVPAGAPDASEASALQDTSVLDAMDTSGPSTVERAMPDHTAVQHAPVEHTTAGHSAAGEAVTVGPSITTLHLDIDSNSSDADSALGDVDFQSSTVSVRSSIYDMVEENGRTYHRYKEGKYVLPNDEFEQNRLDMQHHLFLMTLSGALHLAPLREGIQDVLDLATGTGIWAIEFATKYPSARVVGTDLSPIQPLYVPPNCSFEVDDADDPWLFAQKFDYIHGRLLVACFADFSNIARQAFEFMKPGGYFELQDLLPFDCADGTWEGCHLQRLMNLLREGAAKAGMDYHKAAKYKTFLADAGFEDVHEVHFAWPSNGRWPKGEHYKNLGRWNFQNMLDGIEGISMGTLTRMHGWTKEQVQELVAGVKQDLADRRIHAYLPVRVVYGRKPLE